MPERQRGLDGQGSDEEDAAIAAALGRPPQTDFDVVVRDATGVPIVIRNAPFTHDGTPMPTTYWLVGRLESASVGRLEARGGVVTSQSEVDPDALSRAHQRYASERDARIESSVTPRPSGGVGGTRTGVKCLHAHLAWFLAGGDDPVGEWTADQIGVSRDDYLVDTLRRGDES